MTSHFKWPFVKLGDHVDLLAGFAFKSSSFTYNASDIPLVKGENLHQGFIDWEAAKKWPSTEYEKHKRFQLGLNDVVLAMDRPWIEAGLKFSWIRKQDPKALLVQRVARLRGRNGLLSEYLRFIVGSPGFTGYIKPIVTGVNVPHISGDQIRSFRFCLPPLPTQRKIAAILSAYDDLIENNLRRIKILEEMAQNIYREWFVKFRFPGHQHAPFTDSPLGRVPEGWEVVKVGDILKKVKRGTKIQKKDYAAEGLIPVVDQGKEFIGGYTDNTESLISYDLPLIVFGDHTRVLKFIDFPFACGADGTQLLKSDDERMPMSLFYYALSSIDLSDFAYARHFKFLKEEALILPAKSIADLFDQFVSPLRDQSRSLMQKNTTLRRTRDLLLPRLISGEVDVSELGIAVPEEASA